MTNIVQKLEQKGLAHPPKWLSRNVHYLTVMGSISYGVSNDSSDVDVYGFCMPPKDDIFPHMRGEIPGFGRQKHRFEQYQEHHIEDKETRKEYDLSIYSIVKYFHLCMENNPNMIDSLFTPRRCVLFTTSVGELVRENRKLFLHKGAFHKLKGYAYSQLHKIDGGANRSNPKRQADIDKHGWDLKFGYHVVRLACEAEQILAEHDLDLERNREQLKAVRRGEWSLDYLKEWFAEKEKSLEELYARSTLRHEPDEDAIRELLIQCLEQHYGNLSEAVKRDVTMDRLMNEMQSVLDKYR